MCAAGLPGVHSFSQYCCSFLMPLLMKTGNSRWLQPQHHTLVFEGPFNYFGHNHLFFFNTCQELVVDQTEKPISMDL